MIALAVTQQMTALGAAGPEAASVRTLILTLFGIGAAVWFAVVGTLVLGARREADGTPAAERRATGVIGLCLALTIVILLIFLGIDYRAGRALIIPAGEAPLKIAITGRQWWWDVTYSAEDPPRMVATANEIHIPTGRNVELTLQSRDVIHSFWIPSLAGKRDLIPGHPRKTVLRATTAGVYSGMCAEYCGLQHARMRIVLVAEPPDQFDRWYRQQLAEASDVISQGKHVFLSANCPMCHTVRGTPAGSKVGPDLTHFASRQTIGAGALPRTDDALRKWIANPERFKPGVRMPGTALPDSEMVALTAYLQGLR